MDINYIRFPQDIAPTTVVESNDRIIIAKINGETFTTTLSRLSKFLGDNGQQVEPVSPGELPYLDTFADKFMQVTEEGDYYFEGELLANNPNGYITVFWWSKGKWEFSNQYRVLGEKGDSVTNAEVNGDGELVITYSTGVVENIGVVRGVGVANTNVDSNGDLIITLTNGESQNSGRVKGDKGDGLKIDGSGTEAERSLITPEENFVWFLVPDDPNDPGYATVFVNGTWVDWSTTTGSDILNPNGEGVPKEKAVANYVTPLIDGVNNNIESSFDNIKAGELIVNKIVNGDLSNSITGWTTGGLSTPAYNSKNIIGSGSIKMSPTAQTSITYQDVDFPNGHIIYFAAWGFFESTTGPIQLLRASDKGGDANAVNIPLEQRLNRWQRISGLKTVTNGGIRFRVGSSSNQTMVVYFDGMTAIDLTAIYGAGNEPAKEVFESDVLKYYSNQYVKTPSYFNNLSVINNKVTEVLEDINYYTGVTNLFKTEDLQKYPALKLFKSLSFELQGTVNNISLLQVYITPANVFTVTFNINGLTTGGNYSQNILFTQNVSSAPATVTAVKHSGGTPFNLSNVSFEFDLSKFNQLMQINNASTAVDNRIKINQNYVDNLTLKQGSLNKVVLDQSNDRRALIGTQPFSNKGYIDNRFLDLILDFEIVDLLSDLQKLSITNIDKPDANTLQIILNENDAVHSGGVIWQQTIVLSADVSGSPSTVTLEGQASSNPKSRVKIVFNYAGWDNSMIVNRQTIANNDLVRVDESFIKETKENFRKTLLVSDLIKYTPAIGDEGYLGNLKYRRISTGNNESAYARLFDYHIPKAPKLKVKDIASKTTMGNFVDITDDGKIRVMDLSQQRIRYYNTFEEAKTSITPTIQYALKTINPDFLGNLTYFFQLEDKKILIYERSVSGYIGGLWILDEVANTLVKTFTFRNSLQECVPNWNVEILNKTIYFAEYGNGNPGDGGSKADATKLWRSTDNGLTWSEVYDFINFPGVVTNGLHLHTVHYDVHWNRLWVATGDIATAGNSSKRLFWSDDFGVTWKSQNFDMYYGAPSNPNNSVQFLSMYSNEDFLLLGGDDYNNCIYRISKKDKTVDWFDVDQVYKYDLNYNDRITQFTGRFHRLKCGLIVVALTNGDTAPRKSRLLGTYDGLKWYELYSAEQTSELINGNYGVIIERGEDIYYQYSDENTTGGTRFNLVKLAQPEMI